MVTVQPSGTPEGTRAGKSSWIADLTALLMIGDGTGSPLSVVGPAGDDSVAGGSALAVGEGEMEPDVVGSVALGLSPPSSPHPTTVTATSASPATAFGIPFMRTVCLLFPPVVLTTLRTAANP